jgi:hypothetical protein
VWSSTEQTLLPRAKAQILNQFQDRFPTATGVLLIGPMVGHYYTDDTPVDVLVAVPSSSIKDYKRELEFINGRILLPTEHQIFFYLVPNTVSVDILTQYFGPVYDVLSGIWYGPRVTDITELARPSAILQRIAWQLYRYKNEVELFPELWTPVFAAFEELGVEEQNQVVDALRFKIKKLDVALQKLLKNIPNAAVWKAVDSFEDLLNEDQSDDVVPATLSDEVIPKPVLFLVLHKFRYEDITERLVEKLEKLKELKQMQLKTMNLPIEASVKKTVAASKEVGRELLRRLKSVFDVIYQATGGRTNAVDTTITLFTWILDNNRFVQTTAQKRLVALALYRRYYRGIE